jgi:hypothetical protein
MDSFFDSCIVINYLEYFIREDELKKKCFSYISNKKGKFFLCFYGLDEINKEIEKREIQGLEILRKKKDKEYLLGSSKIAQSKLNKKEISFLEQLYKEVGETEYNYLKNKFEKEIDTLKINLQIFLKNNINEISIKTSEIDKSILSILFDFIEDYADCKILTSAIQMQKNREQFLFVTADKHFPEGTYNSICEDTRLKGCEKPVLKNFLFEV